MKNVICEAAKEKCKAECMHATPHSERYYLNTGVKCTQTDFCFTIEGDCKCVEHKGEDNV